MIVPHRRSLWARSDRTPLVRARLLAGVNLSLSLNRQGLSKSRLNTVIYAAIRDEIACGHEKAVSHDWQYLLGHVWRRADRGCQEEALFNSSATQSRVAAES